MKIFRGARNVTPHANGRVVTIGNFDGFHLGHRKIVEQIIDIAKEKKLVSTLITFEPYPQEFFQSDRSFPRLTRFREKVFLLQQAGLDEALFLPFNQRLANLSAENFVAELLVNRLNAKHVVIGDDFRFGHRRLGDYALLQRMGQESNFAVSQATTFLIDSQRVSSTRVRETLLKNELGTASRLLGRDYSICGVVVHGDKRGRTIGFPTANVFFKKTSIPLRGVYAVEVRGFGTEAMPGVANIGLRPTVDGQRMTLEVHLFDFDGDIYGHRVDVVFKQYIRGEQKFSGLAELKAQIAQDCTVASAYFAHIVRKQ